MSSDASQDSLWQKDSRERRALSSQRQKQDRVQREREAKEDDEIRDAIRRRLTEGDMRATVVDRVVGLLKTDEVQARVAARASAAITARRAEVLAGVEAARSGRIAAARAEEESRLSEARLLEDILAENTRKVKEAAAREAEAARERQRERAPAG